MADGELFEAGGELDANVASIPGDALVAEAYLHTGATGGRQ